MEWKLNSESFPKEKFDPNSVTRKRLNVGVRGRVVEQREKIDGVEPYKGF
jgi:hypothetical protein